MLTRNPSRDEARVTARTMTRVPTRAAPADARVARPRAASDGLGPASTALTAAGNRLLAGLPEVEAAPLLAAGERVRPRMREELYAQDGPMPDAYFPLRPQGAVFSLAVDVAGGGTVEVLAVGSEGVLGVDALMGATRSPTRAACLIAGWAFRVPVAALHEGAPPGGVLAGRLARYAQARAACLARTAACARLHSAQQRYARWVLTAQDRAGADELPVTQDLLARLLGVTRPTISQVGQELQAAGLVHHAQGRLTVDDRAGLERAACECYGAVRAAYDELLEGAEAAR